MATNTWAGNKGEWSESYTFLKLLTNPLVSAANSRLSIVPGKYYVAKRIIVPFSTRGPVEFAPLAESYKYSESAPGVSIQRIKAALPKFLEAIQSGTSAFEIPLIAELFIDMGLDGFKAASGKKMDIHLTLPSLGGGQDLDLGFSIKSQLGSASTLFNASGATNIDFEIRDKSFAIEDFSGLKYHESRSLIRGRDARLHYLQPQNESFLDNLEFFGSDFPAKLASLVENAFMDQNSGSTLTENIQIWAADNGGQIAEKKLVYQLKNFLRATALGMRPGTPWAGDLEGYGGYLIVAKNGDLLCLHLENDDEFKSYLLQNTRFDFPKDELIAKPRVESGKLVFPINFQIRFIK
jgi:type II restriction enzyme